MTTENQQIANTILSQLGGNRFALMTGAKNFMFGPKGDLSFSIPKTNKINKVKITLDKGTDTYTIEFINTLTVNQIAKRIQNKQENLFDVVARVDNVYCESLQETFTRHTGLYTKL